MVSWLPSIVVLVQVNVVNGVVDIDSTLFGVGLFYVVRRNDDQGFWSGLDITI